MERGCKVPIIFITAYADDEAVRASPTSESPIVSGQLRLIELHKEEFDGPG